MTAVPAGASQIGVSTVYRGCRRHHPKQNKVRTRVQGSQKLDELGQGLPRVFAHIQAGRFAQSVSRGHVQYLWDTCPPCPFTCRDCCGGQGSLAGQCHFGAHGHGSLNFQGSFWFFCLHGPYSCRQHSAPLSHLGDTRLPLQAILASQHVSHMLSTCLSLITGRLVEGEGERGRRFGSRRNVPTAHPRAVFTAGSVQGLTQLCRAGARPFSRRRRASGPWMGLLRKGTREKRRG